ncbi:hypothetical protein K503DRAFT_256829 [Rhizopogon vinicolor AM-OR11-026]|uniref:Zinc-finger domain-containing protein n=1 Tax=Rhizopogon vinicolor AM-OR11-026 TaxID=1314800 RepID=A0A1B7MWV3_9AGAM|nr:hypothetical protein K503DRAFT_256829 [Rhizopogon vinicolor AM-OR11-026]
MGYASYDSPFSTYPLLLSQLRPAPLDAESSQDPRRTASRSARSSRPNASNAHDISSSSLPASLIYRAPSLSHSSSTVFVPDLKPLKLATLQRALGQLTAYDSGVRVCQYEVPGGGVCRDKDCNDLHLSRLVSEPSGTYRCMHFLLGWLMDSSSFITSCITPTNSDAELAAYVHGILPQTWRSRCDVRAIEIALERVRLGGSATNLDERVRGALAGLGIPVTPSIES